MSEAFTVLAPELLVTAALLAPMGLEIFRAPAAWSRRAFLLLLVAAVAMMARQWAEGATFVPVPGEVAIDGFALAGRLVVGGIALAAALAFRGVESPKHWLLLGASTLGGLVMVSSVGFIPLFLGIELLSLPAFAMVVLGRGDSVAPEAAFKYLVLSSLASAMLLFGVSIAYGATGTLSIEHWAGLASGGGLLATASALLILCALLVKAAVFPFHAWAPDAYAGARLQVTAILASLVKASVVLAMARVLGAVPLDPGVASIAAILGLASILVGNLAALRQQRFRRLLAYSSVAHAGYMAFALVDATGHRPGDLLLYTAIYAAGTLLACGAFAVLCPAKSHDDDTLDRLDGAFARRPVAAALLAIAVLSLAGLPPFPGFLAKLAIFRSVVASGHLLPAVLAFCGSFAGLAYYVAIVLRLFRDDAGREPAAREPAA